ncbi:MAG: NAD-dependent epimerase/dehydratase family protein [Elusimicrobiaceae bacterium]|nr:NAD-dependent epimerase/dehydratase family protein [Elusimicrobiaceae bacterium]
MKTAVITGGQGFVGQRLCEKLLSEGYKVKIFSRSAYKGAPRENVEVIKVDYSNIAALRTQLEGVNVVFHLAACLFGYNYQDFYKANVGVSKNLCAAAQGILGLDSFVYLSSQAAAGPAKDKKHPIDETCAPCPVSDYGRTKLGAEEYVLNLPDTMHRVILRAPVVFGRNDSGVSKIASWVKRGLMVNTSSGETYFNFIYIEDLVNALYLASTLSAANAQVFFVGEDKSYSWTYFITTMAEKMGVPRPFMFTLPLWALEAVAWCYQNLAKVFKFAPALNYDKVREAAIKGDWVFTSKKWITLSSQEFTPLEQALEESFK